MERYAVGAEEQKINTLWKGLAFAHGTTSLKSALLLDIKEKFKGNKPLPSDMPVLTAAGILVSAPFSKTDEMLCRTYGGDAFRLALLCEKEINTETILPYWRFVNKAWVNLRSITPSYHFDASFQRVMEALLKDDFYHALTHLKSVINEKHPALPFFFYPFLPHLITTLFPDVPLQMNEIKWEKQTFIKVFKNGKYCDNILFKNQTKSQIVKEALCLDALHGTLFKRIIYKKGSVLNVLV